MALTQDEINTILSYMQPKQKVNLSQFENDVPFTPTTLRWEQLVNMPLLREYMEKSGLFQNNQIPDSALKSSYLLSTPYMGKMKEVYNAPHATLGDFDPVGFRQWVEHVGGTATPDGKIFLHDNQYIPKESMPNIFRHEVKHQYLPNLYGANKNYGYVSGKGISDLNRFLSNYSQNNRAEEQAAEAFAGRTMPEQLRQLILKNMYGY